jgi:hypothetical protein
MEAIYYYLISSSWFFLLGWILMLVGAGVVAFRDTPESTPSPRPGNARQN